MRGITGTLVVLLALGYFASSVRWSASPCDEANASLVTDGWRRTAQGWERLSDWMTPGAPPWEPHLCGVRPWTVAAIQLLLSLLALQLTRRRADKTRRAGSQAAARGCSTF